MRLIVLIAFIGLLLTFTPSQAQTDSIDPALIFATPLEIRHVEAEQPQTRPYMADNNLQVFVVDGVVSHYPDNFTDIFSINPLNETTLLFSVNADRSLGYTDDAWLYNRTQHTFTAFGDACAFGEGTSVQRPLHTAEELWTIVMQGDGAYLCNRLTGEKSPVLPGNHQWGASYYIEPGYITSFSPDWRYVAFIGEVGLKPQASSGRNIEIFSYDTQTGKIFSLGMMQAGSSLYFDQWVGSQVTLATGETNFTGSIGISVADAAKANSLDYAVGVAGGAPVFVDNPPRYFTGYGANSPVPCGQTTYYIETRQLVELNLDGLCHPEYGEIEGVGYYRDVPHGETYECCTLVPADVAEVPLVRYDTRTGERKELYRGEIENVYWVSPDDHYAILLIDQNKRIDFFPYLNDYDSFSHLGIPYAELIDLQTGKRLAGITMDELDEASSLYDDDADWAVKHSIIPMADGTFIEIACYEVAVGCARNGNAALRLTVTGDEATETFLVYDPIMLTPDKTGLFTWSQLRRFGPEPPPEKQGINIYDLNTGAISPFIQELDPAHYNFQVRVNDEHSVDVMVEDKLSGVYRYFRVYFESGQPAYIQVVDPPPPPIGKFVCVLTTQTGVNLRVGPAGNLDRAGTAEKGEKLLAIGQTISTYDDLIWWQLEKGGWVRSDFVTPTSACDTLPDTNPASTPAVATTESAPANTVPPDSSAVCNLAVLTGANLRGGPGVEFDKAGSAGANQVLTADGQFANAQNFFTWWRLTTGEWVREDFVAEDATCSALPQISP